MKLLLDTHLLLWAASQPERLTAKARKLINYTEYDLVFSAASFWEIAIKSGLARNDLAIFPAAFCCLRSTPQARMIRLRRLPRDANSKSTA